MSLAFVKLPPTYNRLFELSNVIVFTSAFVPLLKETSFVPNLDHRLVDTFQ